MPLDRYFIEDTLAALEENIVFLQQLAEKQVEEFVSSRESCYAAAYALMISIEAISGIASHLIAAQNFPTPRGMAHSFKILGEQGVLTSSSLVNNLGQMSRFRNLVVHRYWQVDFHLVHRILNQNLEDFSGFASEILHYLDNLNN